MPGYKLIVKNAKVILKTVTNAVLNISGIKDSLTGDGSVDSNNKINWTLQEYTNTAANFTSNNPILLLGQKGIETDDLLTAPKFKIGDGVTSWNTLPYVSSGGGSGVQTVSGTTVDNTDPLNPVVNVSTFQEITDAGNTTTNGIVVGSQIDVADGTGAALVLNPYAIQLTDLAQTGYLIEADVVNDIAKYKGVELATVNDIPTVDTTIIDGSTNPVDGNAVFDGLALKVTLNTLSNIFASCTVVGWASYTTSVVDVIDLGNVYMININISGTSNSATTTVQLPYTNNGHALLADITLGTSNGTNVNGRWVMSSGSDTISFNASATAGNYGATGTKSVYASLMLPK